MAIIGISGHAQSGKDKTASIIQEFCPKQYWVVQKFATPLKTVAAYLTGFPVDAFEDNDFKCKRLGEEWGCITVREFLQKLGTDAVRNNLHKNTWVNQVMSTYESYLNHPNWIITDVRFPNEADAILKNDGFIIRLNRQVGEVMPHESETALDHYQNFKYVIDNNGSLDFLKDYIRNILKSEKLL
jgi:hypothetical protein